ncbi:TPA: hypothetical protein ACGIK9_002939 [Acinetobacter baumannii]|uniref:hypothetical protein n=1 Tax=Acinetobacter baumannii TaxID=470 RepID=UPI00338FE1BC
MNINYANAVQFAQALDNKISQDLSRDLAQFNFDRTLQKYSVDFSNKFNKVYELARSSINELKKSEEENSNLRTQLINQSRNCISLQNDLVKVKEESTKQNQFFSGQLKTKDLEIERLKEKVQNLQRELDEKNLELENSKKVISNNQLMFFKISLVNKILYTHLSAYKKVIENWNEQTLYKKQNFQDQYNASIKLINDVEVKSAKTSSIEAMTYLEDYDQSLVNKIKSVL